MDLLPRTVRRLAIVAFTVSLAACAGAPPATDGRSVAGFNPPSTAVQKRHRASWISSAVVREGKTGGLLFVADAANNDVEIFSSKNPRAPIGRVVDLISDLRRMIGVRRLISRTHRSPRAIASLLQY